MLELLNSLLNVVWSLLDVVIALVNVILPFLPLLAWIAYWSLAVNWAKTYDILRRGGYIGVILLMFISIVTWAAVSPPPEGTHSLFGLTVSNFVGKCIYVAMLACIALLCGSVQMSGTFGSLINFSDEAEPESADAHAH